MEDDNENTVVPRSSLRQPTLDGRPTDRRLPIAVESARLVVLKGDAPGRAHRLEEATVIGRGNEANLRLESLEVSRRHAQITRRSAREYVVQDLGSHNGTTLNGVPVGQKPERLAYGDRIGLGAHTLLLFTVHDPLEEQVHRNQRIEAVGQLAAGIAHEFNNVLEAILTNVRYLRGLRPETPLSAPDVRQCFADVTLVTERAADLTRRILNFTRRESVEGLRAPASQCADEVAGFLRRTFAASIRIETAIEADLFVNGHHSELEQVLLNLCLNARDAMPAGGALRIELRHASRQESETELAGSIAPHVAIVVSDTGTGMDDETRRRIFEPFFTTKAPGSGTGLGLAVVYGIITKMGGRIHVDSAPARGARFTVFLPEAEPRPTPAETTDVRVPAVPRVRRGDGCVLLVDDDDAVRRGIERLLGQLGYRVQPARSGLEAIEWFTTFRAEVRAVLLDVDMPPPDGVETFLRLRAIDPTVQVLFMSGHHDEAMRERLLALGALEFFPKPLDVDRLDRSLQGDE